MKPLFSTNRPLQWLFVGITSFFLSACDNRISDFFDGTWGDDNDVVCEVDKTPVTFKKIAYWSDSGENHLEDINFYKLTHIIYDQIGVDDNGELILPNDFSQPGEDSNLDKFEEMLELADEAGIIKMVSIGNADDRIFNQLATNDNARENFNRKLIEFIEEYDLDGIDLNWQFPESKEENKRFKTFTKDLSNTLRDENKLFSFVLMSAEDEDIADTVLDDVLAYPDFINVLALNTTDKDDLHSSLQDAKEAITYWTNRCVVKNKLVLAIPLYSKGENEESYAEIVERRATNGCLDISTSQHSNYNGVVTVTAKTAYTQTNAGGVILKSLQQDVYDSGDLDYSLLSTMDSQVAGEPNTICD